jgi:hypothetical protein
VRRVNHYAVREFSCILEQESTPEVHGTGFAAGETEYPTGKMKWTDTGR